MAHSDESCPIVLSQQWESYGKLAADPYRPWMLLDRQIGWISRGNIATSASVTNHDDILPLVQSKPTRGYLSPRTGQ